MAERKQTPDILGDLLGGGSDPAPATPEPKPAPKPAPARKSPAAGSDPRTSRARASGTRKTSRRAKAAPPQWEYMEVVFRDYGGYRPRYLNGEEQEGWKQASVIYEYLNQLGAEGWELVGVGGRDDREMPAYFKRKKG